MKLQYLLGLLALCAFLPSVSASTNVSDCTNISVSGIYDINESITGVQGALDYCILITADDVILNGTLADVTGAGTLDTIGIKCLSADNVTVQDAEISNYHHNIVSDGCTNMVVMDSILDDAYYGMTVNGTSTNFTSRRNWLADNEYGMIVSNSANLVVGYTNISGAGTEMGISLINADYAFISPTNVIDDASHVGIGLNDDSDYVYIGSNVIQNTSNAVAVDCLFDGGDGCTNLTIYDNIFDTNITGISLEGINNTNITDNLITNAAIGINVRDGLNHYIYYNQLLSNLVGSILGYERTTTGQFLNNNVTLSDIGVGAGIGIAFDSRWNIEDNNITEVYLGIYDCSSDTTLIYDNYIYASVAVLIDNPTTPVNEVYCLGKGSFAPTSLGFANNDFVALIDVIIDNSGDATKAFTYINDYATVFWTNTTFLTNMSIDSENLTYSSKTPLTKLIVIGNNSVYVSSAITELNVSANITIDLNGLNITDPIILRDGVECLDCTYGTYAGGMLDFAVTGFSTYTIAENATTTENDCDNTIDDDFDGLVDCNDNDCDHSPLCFTANYGEHSIAVTLTNVGDGMGGFFDALGTPLGVFLILVGIAGGIVALFMSMGGYIKG